MLDQSFSTKNLRKILDYENRKGVYLEGKFFPEIAKITEEIKRCNADIKEKYKFLSPDAFRQFRNELVSKKEGLKIQKESQLEIELEKISNIITNENLRIVLTKNDAIANKPVYITDDSAATYFALKQVQNNISRLYKVKQADRFVVVNQVKELLEDGFPKFIVKTDIKEFYESIPHVKILKKLNSDNLLTPFSKRIIQKVLSDYRTLSRNEQGVPRGVGISAYLSELYMRDIDEEIKALPGLTYYARYVDDIIAIFTPTSFGQRTRYVNQIKKIVETNYGLKFNEEKTRAIKFPESKPSCLDYLGYQITFGANSMKIALSPKKVEKYKKRIDLIFNSYKHLGRINEKKERKLLINRLRFLAWNTRLLNNKRNILVGIYFSNNLLTVDTDLKYLDDYLISRIDTDIQIEHLKSRLKSVSFREGFYKRKFITFSAVELSKLIRLWKNED